MEIPHFSICVSSLQKSSPPLGGSPELQRGFSHIGLLCMGSVGLLPASLFSCPAPELCLQGHNLGGRVALLAPRLASLNPLPCQLPNAEGEPEHHTVWRTWRWGFNSCVPHPAPSLGHMSGHL